MKNSNYLLTKNYKKSFFSLFFLLLTLCSGQLVFAQMKAFPSAYGAGAYTSGGRGGIVVHVTNLNDSGKGSFREALLMTVPRTIVFDVSGVITLSSYVQMRAENSNVTIAGQTAPEGGITVDGNRLYLTHVDNIIVRHIRFRGGITAKGLGYSKNDSFSSLGNITNQIFDHCSFSWDGDESASWYSDMTVDKVTVQRSIFGEGEKGSLFGGNENAKTGGMSLHHSLFYNVTHRTPNVSGWNGAKIETINNVVWTIAHRLVQSNGSLNWNHIGNYYDFGNKAINNGVVHMHHAIDNSPPKIYTHGNKMVAINNNTSRGYTPVSELNADNRKSHRYFRNAQGHVIGEQLKSNYFVNQQHPLLGAPIPIQSADDAFISVQNDVGCNARLNGDGSVSDNKDVLDSRWLSNVKNGKYVERTHSSTWKVPHIQSRRRPGDFYISNSHIPEAFFKKFVPQGQDHNDIAPSGYTWLEEYLNGVDKSNNPIINQIVEVSPKSAELKLSETLQLNKVFKPSNSTNPSGHWKSTDESIAKVDKDGLVSPISPGNVTIVFQSTTKGLVAESDITVVPNSIKANAGRDQDICKGESITLVASGGSTYLWNTGDVSKAITVSPNEDTIYTVTAYDASGKHSDSDNVKVNVNPLPKVDAGNNITINSGDSVILNATGAASYIWNTGETNSSILVNPTVTTTYTVTGALNGCEVTDSVKVIVNNNPSAQDKVSAGANQTICKRSWTTLTASGGSTYLWSTGERSASINVQPLETTDYTVLAYDNLGNEIGSDDTRVTVKEIPNVSAGTNATINMGESTTLTATGANTYIWSNGATTPSITVSPTATTYYSVTGFTDDGCEASSKALVMVRNTIYYVDKYNGIVTYSAPSQESNSMARPSGNSNAVDQSHSFDKWKKMEATSDEENLKLNTTDSIEGELKTVSLYNNNNNNNNNNSNIKNEKNYVESTIFEFLIFPNPTEGQLNITISGIAIDSKIYLYDLSGKSLYSEVVNADNLSSFTKTLDLSNYESGIYILQLIDNDKVNTKKVILK